jgi:hypothetical protein
MPEESVEVTARWEGSRFIVRTFSWRGDRYAVESNGRQWEDANGFHILCMVSGGGTTVELIFRLNPAGWWIKPPVSAVV